MLPWMPILILLVVVESTKKQAYTSNCSLYYSIINQTYSFESCSTTSISNETSWSVCQTQCCPWLSNQPFSQAAFQQCISGQSSSASNASSSILIIVFVVIAVLIVTLALLCRIYRNYLQNLETEKQQAKLPIYQRGCLTQSANEEKWIEKQNQLDATTITSLPKSEKASCSICFESETEIQLMCEHQFHDECLNEWFKKKQSCPMCRTEVQFLRIKCQKSCQRYLLMKLQNFQHFRKELSRVCMSCFIQKEAIKIAPPVITVQ